MSTQSTRFDLELLTETDAWSIEQFSGNWSKLDDAIAFDGAVSLDIDTTRGIAHRRDAGLSIGAALGNHYPDPLTYYTPDVVPVGLEAVVLLGDFVSDWADAAVVTAGLRKAARMAQALRVPLVLNRAAITINTGGTPIDVTSVHVRGLVTGTTVTDSTTTENAETFIVRSYVHAVAGPWGGGDWNFSGADSSISHVNFARSSLTGSCVRIRNSDIRVKLHRVTVPPMSLGGIRVSADTDTGVGQAITVLDDVMVTTPTSASSLFGLLIDGGDHVVVRDLCADSSATYSTTVIKVSNVQRCTIDGVRAANQATSGMGGFLWVSTGVTQCVLRRGAIHWRSPVTVGVDGPADLVLEQLVVSGVDATGDTITTPYVASTQDVRALVYVIGTGLRLTMRNVTATGERSRVYFQSVQIAPTYPCTVRTEDCTVAAPAEEFVVDRYDGVVRDGSAAGMVVYVSHAMMICRDLDLQTTTVVPTYTHSPS